VHCPSIELNGKNHSTLNPYTANRVVRETTFLIDLIILTEDLIEMCYLFADW